MLQYLTIWLQRNVIKRERLLLLVLCLTCGFRTKGTVLMWELLPVVAAVFEGAEQEQIVM